jgi:hypothetical protein
VEEFNAAEARLRRKRAAAKKEDFTLRMRQYPWKKQAEEPDFDAAAAARLESERPAAKREESESVETGEFDADRAEGVTSEQGSVEEDLAQPSGAEDGNTVHDVFDLEGALERLGELAEQIVVISTEAHHIAVQLGAGKEGRPFQNHITNQWR